jgi:AcrR family transcriptional regulator
LATGTLRELRRGQIIAKAREIVSQKGLHALTVKALEDGLSFTRGVITYHFKNKQEIVHAVLESAIAEIDAAVLEEVEAKGTFLEKVGAVIGAVTAGFLNRKEAGQITIAFWGRLQTDPSVQRMNAELYARYRHQGASLVRRGQREGALRADVDADAVGAFMVGSVIGITTQAYFQPGCIDVDAAVALASESLLARLTP